MMDRWLFGLARVAFVVGCLAGLGCAPRLSLGATCARTSDCPEPLVCAFDERCREACTTSRDCAVGLICVRDPSAPEPTSAARVCSLELEGCRAATCPDGLICVEEVCVNRCTIASDCPDGVCRSDQTCEPLRAALDADLDAADPMDARAADVASIADTGATDAASADVATTDAGSPDAPASRELGEALLTPPGSLAGAASVAINADGSVVLLGTPRADGFDRTMGAVDPSGPDAAGSAVALSASGSLALIGAPARDSGATREVGAAVTFVRSGTPWTLGDTLLEPADRGAAADHFGSCAALSGDGTRAVVGGMLTLDPADVAGARVFLLR